MLRFVWLLLALGAAQLHAADKPPVYLWLEPEWFDGVSGSFAYWTGEAKPTGAWGVAGPGISAEWTQGGESEWNSTGAPAAETKAVCGREVMVPRAGKYKAWVRYVDHRKKTEPFTLRVTQGGKASSTEFGAADILPPNDEYQLYWGFSFGWASADVTLAEGAARVELVIDKAGEGWRQVDALLLTDDATYTPVGREKPPFAYLASFDLRPKWAGVPSAVRPRVPPNPAPDGARLAGRSFSMWTQIDPEPKWWAEHPNATKAEAFFHFSPPQDIRKQFHEQFAGRKDVPILSWPGLTPGFYLGATPDLSPGTPLRAWLEKTKTPFYVLTNYASGNYTDKTGPATFQALTGPLADQFLGYIHGEAVGTGGVALPDKPLAATRREHVQALGKQLRKQQAEAWSKVYKTPVPEDHWAKGISCLSVDSISLAHLFHETGAKVVGYELDATNVHAPMRIAFERGAARQYGGAWINYASGNFGDACNYFTQQPVVPRGAPGWFHSKYAITDGVSASWYRKMYYLNYLSGASAILWEQNLGNQWMLPGPGKHPVQLSPFGRGTEDFLAFVDRLPDRGEPLAPVALLLSAGHAYERVNYSCKMLHVFPESVADRELRELFNVCWHPAGVVEGHPAAPDVQSLPNGRYGNIFDVLVDRPERAKAMFNYPVVWAAGDVDLAPLAKTLDEHVRKGGTLVVNVEAARKLPPELLGVKLTGFNHAAEAWAPAGGAARAAVRFPIVGATLTGAEALATAGDHPIATRHKVGDGAVVTVLVPHGLGHDERAHPLLPYLMNGLTAGLLPIEVTGDVQYQVNRTKDGYVVLLMNNRGVDKTQSGVARVDRRQFADVVLKATLPVKSAKEWTGPRDLTVTNGEVRVRVPAGDVQVIGFVMQ